MVDPSNVRGPPIIGDYYIHLVDVSFFVSYHSNLKEYVASCSYLIASMGLQVLWSSGLACLDIYALRIKRDLHNPVLVSLFVVGDWVCIELLSFLAYVM